MQLDGGRQHYFVVAVYSESTQKLIDDGLRMEIMNLPKTDRKINIRQSTNIIVQRVRAILNRGRRLTFYRLLGKDRTINLLRL